MKMYKSLKKGKKMCVNEDCCKYIPINQNICPFCKILNKKEVNNNIKFIDILKNFNDKKWNKKNIKEIKWMIKKMLFTDEIYNINKDSIKYINKTLNFNKKYKLNPNKLIKIVKNKADNNYFFTNNISYIKLIEFNKNYLSLIASFSGNSKNLTLNAFELNDVYLWEDDDQKGYLSIDFNKDFNFSNIFEFDKKILFIDLIDKRNDSIVIGIIFNNNILKIYWITFDINFNIQMNLLFQIKEDYKIFKFKKIVINEKIYLLITTLCGKINLFYLNFNKNEIIFNKEYNKYKNFCVSSIDILNEENFIISTLDGCIYIYNIFEDFPVYEFHSYSKPINNLIWDISGNFIFFNDEFENNCISCFYFTENNKNDKNKTFKKNFKWINNILDMKIKNEKMIVSTKYGYVYIIDISLIRNNIIKPKYKDLLHCKTYYLDNNNILSTYDSLKLPESNQIKDINIKVKDFSTWDSNKIKNCDYWKIENKEVIIFSKNKILTIIENNI